MGLRLTVDPSEVRPGWTLSRIRGYLPSFALVAAGFIFMAYTLYSYEGDMWCMAVGIGLAALSLLASVFFWGASSILEGVAMSAEIMDHQVFWDPYDRVIDEIRRFLEHGAIDFEEYSPVEYTSTGRNEFARKCFQQRVKIGIDSEDRDDSHIIELNGGQQIAHVVFTTLERLRTTHVSLYPKADENRALFANILDWLRAELDAFEGLESMPDWYRAKLEAEAD